MSEDNLSSKYFEGKPCRKCESLIRRTSDKRCINCSRVSAQRYNKINPEKRHERHQKWYQANLEKSNEKSRMWRQTNPQKVRENYQKSQHENPEKNRERNRKWREANLQHVHEKAQIWRRSNLEKARKNYQNWCQENPEKAAASHQVSSTRRKARKKHAEGSYTAQEWITLKEQYGNRCLCCGRHQSELDRVLEQDHIIPLSRGGTNWITNIQPLCHDCNGMGGKGTKTIDYRNPYLTDWKTVV